jgi:hypothetical protein
MLKQPVVGGRPHVGIHPFRNQQDPDYVTMRHWLSGMRQGSSCVPPNN